MSNIKRQPINYYEKATQKQIDAAKFVMNEFLYYSSENMSIIDFEDIISPRYAFKKLIAYLLSEKGRINRSYIETCSFLITRSYAIPKRKKSEFIDKTNIFLQKYFEVDSDDLLDKQAKKLKQKNIVKNYCSRLENYYKKLLFENYEAALEKKFSKLVSNIKKDKDIELDKSRLQFIPELVAYYLFKDQTFNQMAKYVKKKNYEFSKNYNPTISDISSFLTSFTYHMKQTENRGNSHTIIFPLIFDRANESKLSTEIKKIISEKFSREGIKISFFVLEEESSIINGLDLKNKSLKPGYYISLSGYRDKSYEGVLRQSLERHVNWLFGFLELISCPFKIDFESEALIYDELTPSYAWYTNYNLELLNNGSYILPENTLTELIILNENAWSSESVKWLRLQLMNKLQHSQAKFPAQKIINSNIFIESLPFSRSQMTNAEARSSIIFDVISANSIKSFAKSIILWNKKTISTYYKLPPRIENVTIVDLLQHENSMIYLDEIINKTLKINEFKMGIFFMVEITRMLRNEAAHKGMSKISQMDNLLVDALDTVQSIFIIGFIKHIYGMTSDELSKASLLKVFSELSERSVNAVKRFGVSKDIWNILIM